MFKLANTLFANAKDAAQLFKRGAIFSQTALADDGLLAWRQLSQCFDHPARACPSIMDADARAGPNG